jgi:hypothetical protein
MAAAPAHMQRDFTPVDLWRILSRNRFEGAIARPVLGTPEEQEWLADLQARHKWILAVAGPRPDVVETAGYEETPESQLAAAAQHTSNAVLIRGATLANADAMKRLVPRCLSLFGPERMMWGSRWPFCMDPGTGGIGIWKESLAAFTQAMGAQTMEAREWILGGAAARIYTTGV